MKEPWSIKTRSRACAGTEKAFTDGQPIHAAIFPDPESSGYLRRDYSEEAWAELSKEDTPFSHWKTVYKKASVEEKQEDVVDEDPETLLRRLVEEEEEHTENARYILAVMLERKKLLRETDTQQLPSGILRVYEHRKTGDVFIIKDPQIPLSEVANVQDEISELLAPKPIVAEEPPAEPAAEPEVELAEPAEQNTEESSPETTESVESAEPAADEEE